MTAEKRISGDDSLAPEVVRLVGAAQKCESLSNIDDHLPYRNFGDMWATLVSHGSDRPWIGYYPCASDEEQPEWMTYGQFSEFIDRVASLLSDTYGIAPGGTLATLTINQPLTVATYFAAWRLGARVVPINPGETDERVGYILQNSEATLLIAHGACRKDFSAVESVLGRSLKKAMVTDESRGNHACPADWDDFLKLLDAVHLSEALPPASDISWDSEALVVYTSGTTGNPKGVVLTQKQMFADAYAISQWHRIDEHTVMMNVLPIHHVNGIVVTLITPAFVGAQVIVNKRFRSGGFWRKLARHNVQIVSVVPTLLQFLIDANEDLDPETISNFRYFICGAGPLSVELAREFQDRFGLKILHGYGLSETVCYSCFLPVDLEWHEHNRWMYDHGFPSIGCPIVTNEMAIHSGDGQSVPDGDKGEIVIRGYNVMSGYFRNPEANANAFTHGWFRSGDEGFKIHGEDGRDYFFITGRIKELIIRGGINISPFEIDEVLNAMPGIRVGLAVGFENRYYGEEVGAYVQAEDGKALTEAGVIAHCQAHLPGSKSPKVVIFGDDIPVTSTGKYQRGKLKHLFEAYKDKQFR
ncbi:MAG: acyl--CoA ligase [Phycisphaerales bacterium]|nr:acyl--CoA ligase [Phycisphaerales bacterium]